MTTRTKKRNSDQPSAPDYEVGYGRPPVHSRVKPGQVLNKRGRPKGQRNVATVLENALNERIQIKQGNRTLRMTKLDAIVLQIVNGALANAKGQANFINFVGRDRLFRVPDAPPHQAPLTADDEGLIADHFARNREMLQDVIASEPPQLNTEAGKPAAKGAKNDR